MSPSTYPHFTQNRMHGLFMYTKTECAYGHTRLQNVLSTIFVCEIASDCHDTASSSSLPSSPHSKSLDSVPLLLECPCEIVHLARR